MDFYVFFWSCRVIPHRFSRPMEYRLYLELLKRHGFNFHFQMKAANFRKYAFPSLTAPCTSITLCSTQ